MGHHASLSGRIEITPPIPWREFATSPYHRVGDGLRRHHGYSLEFSIRVEQVETERGMSEYRDAVAIVPYDGDELRGDDILDILQAIADAHGRGRTFTGRIDARWPDWEFESRRYKIVDGRAREYSPTVAWPEESE